VEVSEEGISSKWAVVPMMMMMMMIMMIKFHLNLSTDSRVTDGRTDMTMLTVAFAQFCERA
jgi:hypothetical protein